MRRREIMLDDAILTNSLKKKKKTYTGTVLDKKSRGGLFTTTETKMHA